MAVIVALSAWLGLMKREASAQRRVLEAVKTYGGTVEFEDEIQEPRDPIEAPFADWSAVLRLPARNPSWIERKLGPEYVKRIARVTNANAKSTSGDFNDSTRKPIDRRFLEALRPLHSLRELELADSRLDLARIAAIAQIPNLRGLALDFCAIDDNAFALAPRFPSLERLDLYDLRVPETAGGLKALSRVGELSLYSRTPPGSLEFLRQLPQLERLHLYSFSLAGTDLAPLESLHRLRVLRLMDVSLEDSAFDVIDSLRWIEMLDLGTNPKISAAGLARLSRMPNLRRLGVAATSFGDESLPAIRDLPRLESLDASGTKITPKGIAEIGLPPTLVRLGLGRLPTQVRLGLGRSPSDPPPPEDEAMAAIGKLTRLRELSLINRRITDGGCAELSRLTALETLDLSGAGATNLEGLDAALLARLEKVDLSSTGLTNAGFARICRAPNLKVLVLRDTTVSSLAGADFRNLAHLECLDLYGTSIGDVDLAWIGSLKRLRRLNLGRTKVGDAGIKALVGLANLETVSLLSMGVTDAGLWSLRKAPALHRVALGLSPGLTRKGIAKFEAARPDVVLEAY